MRLQSVFGHLLRRTIGCWNFRRKILNSFRNFLTIKNFQLYYPTRYEKIITVSAAFHFGRGGGFPAPTMIRPFRNRKP